MTTNNTLNLAVGGMSCASCSSTVEKALLKVQGVTQATVNLATEKAQIDFAAPATPEQIAKAVVDAGYDAEILNASGEKASASSAPATAPATSRKPSQRQPATFARCWPAGGISQGRHSPRKA